MNFNKLSRPIRVTVVLDKAKIFERVFVQHPIIFGRSPTCQVPLEFEFISRSHGMVTEENGLFVVADLGSQNGIYVGGQRTKKVTLGESGSVTIGKIELQFDLLPAVDKTAVINDDKTAVTVIAKSPSHSASASVSSSAVTAKTLDPVTENRFKVPVQPPAAAAKVQKTKGVRKSAQKIPAHSTHFAVFEEPQARKFYQVHPEVMQNPRRTKVVEAVVTWLDQIYDMHLFNANEKISVGTGPQAILYCPILRETMNFASVGSESTVCFIPQGHEVTLRRGTETWAMGDLIAKKLLQQNDFGYALKLDYQDSVSIDLGSSVKIHLRYIPAPKEVYPQSLLYLERAMKAAMYSSSALHFVLLMIALLTPRPPAPFKLKNVPDRYARLLMDKPKPKPTPPPAKKEEPPKLAKRPEPKPKTPPKKIVHKALPRIPMKPPKQIAKLNKWPMVVKHPVKMAPPPVKVEQLGALAALGAISKTAAPSNTVTNININKDAGGIQTKVNTGGIVGALPSSHGQLATGGGSVKTKGGKGFGTGKGYGMQGLRGTAGARGIAGAIVGEPKLAQATKSEGLTRAQVMAVVKKYIGEIQSCYERSLLQDPGLRGRMEFEWDISPSGKVTLSKIKRSQVQNGDVLGECVRGVIMSMRFPRATNGQTTTPNMGFPFGTL